MVDGPTSDVTQADLGAFDNASAKVKFAIWASVWAWLKSVITFLLSIIMVVIVTMLDIVPRIFTLLHNVITVITGAAFPVDPGHIPGANWLALTNTFFPLKEALAALALYYTLYFALLVVKVSIGIAAFGLRYSLEIFKILVAP